MLRWSYHLNFSVVYSKMMFPCRGTPKPAIDSFPFLKRFMIFHLWKERICLGVGVEGHYCLK